MFFTIAYTMSTGMGSTSRMGEAETITRHKALTDAGASRIVIRDLALHIVTLPQLIVLEANAHRT